MTLTDARSAAGAPPTGATLVLISSSVSPGGVGVALRHSPVPVVSWEPRLFEDLGMTSAPGSTVSSQATLSVLDAQHPLAAGKHGRVTVYTSKRELSSGTPNGAAAVVATSGAGHPVIFAYEKGAPMPGLTAPARRVRFFIGAAAGDSLSSDGLALFDAAITWAVAPVSMGPLRVHPANPRYFSDPSGRLVYLTGSHEGSELHDHVWDTLGSFDYGAYLKFLAAHRHNVIRLWVVEHTRTRESATGAVAHPMPYRRVIGFGTALDGWPKFDLDRFDPAYFNRLRSRVLAARDRGIYVVVMLFQGVSIWSREDNWFGHYFNKRNNVQGLNGDLNGDGFGFETHSLASPAVVAVQRRYVEKVIETLNDLDKVLYEIANEDGRGTAAWQYAMIDHIKRHQATLPRQHPVGITFRYPGTRTLPRGTNAELFASAADWISPGNEGTMNFATDPPAATGAKIILLDTDHVHTYTRDRRWPWRAFLRGHHPWVIDELSDMTSVSPFESIRRGLGDTRVYAARMSVAAMTPHDALSSTGYCLADAGAEYLVYQPDSGGFSVRLAPGRYRYEWFNPSTGTVEGTGTWTASGGSQYFTPPFSGDALLYVKKQAGVAPRPRAPGAMAARPRS